MPKHEYLLGGKPLESSVEKHESGYQARVGDRQFEIRPLGDNLFAATVNGRRKIIAAAEDKGIFYLDIDCVQLELHPPGVEQFSGAVADHAAQKDKVFAPMPGKIVKILVEIGEEVREEQPMVIVEAMKMENQVDARAPGKVKAINFGAGDQVDTESPIIELDVSE